MFKFLVKFPGITGFSLTVGGANLKAALSRAKTMAGEGATVYPIK
jgi:hypothetical protein